MPYFGAAFTTLEVHSAVFWLGITSDARSIEQLPAMNEAQRLRLVGGPRLERESRQHSQLTGTPLSPAFPPSTRQPLLHYLHITGEIEKTQRWYFSDGTTASASGGQASSLIAYLYRGGREAGEIGDGIMRKVIQWIKESSTLAQNYSRTDRVEIVQLGTERDRLTERMRERFALTFCFRRYFKGKRVDRGFLERIAEMYRRLYFLRLQDLSLPRVELTARTATGLLGAQMGERLDRSSGFLEEQSSFCQRTVAAAVRVAEALAGEEWVRAPVMDYAAEFKNALRAIGDAHELGVMCQDVVP